MGGQEQLRQTSKRRQAAQAQTKIKVKVKTSAGREHNSRSAIPRSQFRGLKKPGPAGQLIESAHASRITVSTAQESACYQSSSTRVNECGISGPEARAQGVQTGSPNDDHSLRDISPIIRQIIF